MNSISTKRHSRTNIRHRLPAVILAGLSSAALVHGAGDRPNIILIMADDLGYGDTGFTGNTFIRTPCLDSLSREGVTLDRFYTAAPVSSPTRASVMTGRHPSRMGVFNANVGILRPEETTIAEILKNAGYATGFFGKWHLGSLTHTERDANRGKPGNLKDYNPPHLHGFDTFFATESKVPTWDPMKKPAQGASGKGWKYIEEGEEWVSYGTSYFNAPQQKETGNLDGDDSRVIMDRTIEYIGGNIDRAQPFLAVIWFHAPHLPVVAGPEFREAYSGTELERNYAGSISAMDMQIGRLADFLREQGQDGNTLIFFCSDNGPEKGTPGSSGMFRERKFSLHEGGIRVASFALWPGHTGSGHSDVPCSTCDYLPTICEITGCGLPDHVLDGKSIAPALLGKGRQEQKPMGFVYQDSHAMIDGRYKLLTVRDSTSLYDIQADPGETTDISASRKGILKKLTRMYEKFISSCKASFEGKEYGTESAERMGQTWKY